MKVSEDQNTVTMTAVFMDNDEHNNCSLCIGNDCDLLCDQMPCDGRKDGKRGYFEEAATCE
jgi:hypothetical protein